MEFTPDYNGLFNSLETGKPFAHCASCRLPLNEPASEPHSGDLGILWENVVPYLVVKSFNKGECIFEYALCEDCRADMTKEFSLASQKHLREFFEKRMSISKRLRELGGRREAEAWIEKCAVCGARREAATSYSIGALFHAGSLMINPYPVCFCGDCEEIMQAGLSKETLGIWDDFIETHFDAPPANRQDLPVGGRPMFI